ncbi:unnamed protein product [Parascedosporium putredinis]|uniref:Endonuclease/exonuclease/phosphatase domain-containing protein n=1 Tax=Parascedosporium putredinis TaxID=1442378 RepID=A0A9P1HAM0_9PEZI|nr:unnamed protein product [Parascedosporium putredinis]CAI8003030.1 unnamed protein product [Parascedosporium putredinis]
MVQGSPLPVEDPEAPCQARRWHHFDESTCQWARVEPGYSSVQDAPPSRARELALYTWNVDAGAESPRFRIRSIISHILTSSPHQTRGWVLSEGDTATWQNAHFSTVTLLSRSRFGLPQASHPGGATLGPVWRVRYPSRFGRDALCCDVFLPSGSSDPAEPQIRVRLVNVHLDSLAIRPSQRPRQIQTVAAYLQNAGHGLVAGDFNPVLDEDATLVADNGLVDAWLELRSNEPGFTWGIDGKQRFPPGRLDKVATLGLEPVSIEVMEPSVLSYSALALDPGEPLDGAEPVGYDDDFRGGVPWSDHCGLKCVVRVRPS